MELIIFLIWCFIVVAVPIALLVGAFIGVRQKADPIFAIGGAVIGLFVHIAIVAGTFFLMFLLIYTGAHTSPLGNALNWRGRLLYLLIEILYLGIVLSFCSLLTGRPRPWPMKLAATNDVL